MPSLVLLVSGSVGWARVSVLRHPVERTIGADHGLGLLGGGLVLDVSWMMLSGWEATSQLYWVEVGSHWTETRRMNVSIGARRTHGVSGTLTMKGTGKVILKYGNNPSYREDLCYLKSGRGYLRNRTDGFISGATFRDGCNQDPYCESPYSYYGHQCLFLSNDFHPWSVSLAEARRNINNTRGC